MTSTEPDYEEITFAEIQRRGWRKNDPESI